MLPQNNAPVSATGNNPFEQQLASGVVALGTTLSDEDRTSSEALSDYARSQATGMLNSNAEAWLNKYGTANVQLNFEKHGELGDSSVDWLVPFYDTPENILFAQLGMRHKDDRNTVNIGLGSRFFLDDNWMFGLNSFIDSDITGQNYRLGMGVEVWGDYIKLSANGYRRLSGWHQSRDLEDYDERPADGLDFRMNGFLPAYPQLGGTLVYEQYFGDEVALFGNDNRQKNPYAVTVGANYTPIPMLTFSAEQRMGKSDQNELNLALNMTLQLDKSLRENMSPDAVAPMRRLSHSRYDLVERNNDIVLEYRKQQVISMSLTPEAISGTSGSVQYVSANVTTKHGLQSLQWQGASFTTAGGKVTTVDASHFMLTLPAWRAAQATDKTARANNDASRLLNTYVLMAVAEDTKGNHSSPEQLTVEVLPPDAQFMGNASVTGDYAPPDGITPINVTYHVVDGNNQPVAGEPVNFSVQFADGTSALQQANANNSGNVDLNLTSTVPGEAQVVARLSNGDSNEVTVHYVDSQPDAAHSSLTASPATLVADGKQTSTLTLTLQDTQSRPVTELNTVSFTLTGVTGTTLSGVNEAEPGDYVATLSGIATGQATITPMLDGKPLSGLSATVSLVSDSSSAHIAPGDMSVTADNALADGTSQNQISVKVTDTQGNPVAGQTVQFSASNGAVIAASGTTDANGLIAMTLTNTLAGTVDVNASVNGQSSSVSVIFKANNDAAQIADGDLIVVADNARANGTEANLIQVKVTDPQGNLLSDATVNFTASNGASSAPSGTTGMDGTVQIPVTSTVAGISNITATINGSSQTVSTTFSADSETANIAAGDLSVIVNHATANGTQTNKVQVKVTDAKGNPLPGESVNFTASNGAAIVATGTTDSDGTLVVPVTSKTAGTSTITATANSSSQSVDIIFDADSATASIANDALVVIADNAIANGVKTNQVQVTVTDANGNALAGQTVSFSASNNAVIASTGTTDTDGILVLPITSKTAGSSTITATINNSQQRVAVTFIADDSSAQIAAGALTVTEDNAIADGSSTNQIQVLVTDATGNAVASQTVNFSASNGATVAASGSTNGSGQILLPVTSKTAGQSTLTATINDSTQTVEMHFIADQKSAQIVVGDLTVLADKAIANGVAINRVGVRVTDTFGNPVADQVVTFSADNNASVAASGKTGSDGTVQMPVSSVTAGISKVTASINGSEQVVSVTFVADSSTAQITAGDLVVVTDGAVANGTDENQVRLKVTDANNNPVAGQPVSFSASNGAQLKSAGVTAQDGTLSMMVTSLQAGTSTVTATVNGKSQSVDMVFKADASTAEIIAGNMTVTANNAKADNSGTNGVQVVVTDANGNPLASQNVSFSADNGAVIAAQGTTNAAGVVEKSVTSTTAGNSKITATVNGSKQSVTVTFLANGDSAHIASHSLQVVADNASANGKATNQVQLLVVDEYNNPVPDVAVSFAASNGATITAQGNTDDSGKAVATLTSKTSGVTTVTATVNGGSQTTDVTFIADSSTATITAGDLAVITDNAVANGVAANQVQVNVTDAYGNAVAGENVSLTASNGADIPASGTTGNDGTLVVSITSLSAGNSVISASVNGTTQTTQVTFVADASTAQIADGNLTIVTNNAVANGSTANTIKVQVEDNNGNPLTGQVVSFIATNGASVAASGTTNDSGSVIMDVTSQTAGTSTVTASTNGSSQSVELVFLADSSTAQISASDLKVTVNNAVANGIAANEVQVTVTDAGGNIVANEPVSFTASNSAMIDASAQTDAQGQVNLPVTSLVAGDSTIIATVNGSSQSVDMQFSADSSSAQIASGDLMVTTDNAVANGTAINEVQVKVIDSHGNAVAGKTVSFTASNNAVIASSAQTDAAGQASLAITSLVAGSSTIVATVNDSSQSVKVNFVADSSTAEITANHITTIADNAIADGAAANQVQVEVTDANGNPLANQTVGFTASNGATVAASGVTDLHGLIVMDITSVKAVTSTINATINNSSQNTDVTFVADEGTAQVAAGALTVVSDNAIADGQSINTVKARVTDANGNPLAGQSVSFNSNNGATESSPGLTDSNGEVSISISNVTAGKTTVTATINGSSQSVDVTFIPDSSTARIVPESMALLNDNASANGTDPDMVQVKVKDANDNPVANHPVDFTADNGAVVAANASTNENGLATVPVTSIRAGTSTVTASVNGSSQSVSATFVADRSTAQILASDIVVIQNGALSDGIAQNEVQVRVVDAHNNVVGNIDVAFSASNGASVAESATTSASGVMTVPVTATQSGISQITASVNGSSQSVEVTFIAATIPVITSVLDNAGTVTHALTSAQVTDDTQPELTGTADSNATIRLFDNGTSVGTTTADTEGNWSVTPDSPISGEGDHTLTVTGALTADSDQSPPSEAFILNLDTVAQLPTIDRLTDGNGDVPRGSSTSGDNIQLSGSTEPDATVSIDVIRVADRIQASLGSVTADSQGQWQAAVTDMRVFQNTSEYIFQAKTTDIAGNSSRTSEMDPYSIYYQSWPAPAGTPAYTLTGDGEVVEQAQVSSLLSSTGNALFTANVIEGHTPVIDLPASTAENTGDRVYISVGGITELGLKQNGAIVKVLNNGSESTWYSDGTSWVQIY